MYMYVLDITGYLFPNQVFFTLNLFIECLYTIEGANDPCNEHLDMTLNLGFI